MTRVLALLICVQAFIGQDAANWRDLSPHQVRIVLVEPSVRVEVLDWGGTGRPILFVGCYLSAHVYDEIAPKLTDRFRVYAVTRRGVGASDRPTTGWPQVETHPERWTPARTDRSAPARIGEGGSDLAVTSRAWQPR